MTTITTFTGILYLALAFIVGLIASYFFKKASGGNFKSEYDSLNVEHEKLSKDAARAQKSLDKSHTERDNWKQKYEEIKAAMTAGNSGDRETIKKLKADIVDVKKDVEMAQAEKYRGVTKYDRLRTEFESYKKKMNSEKEAIKRYKSELEAFRKSDKSQKDMIEKLNKKTTEMQLSLEKQFQAMSDVNELKSLNRRLKAKNVKLLTDLEYWEKKHFETHHQLAKLKKSIEQEVS